MSSNGSIEAFHRTVMDWGPRHYRTFPWRENRDPYAVFVAELLLQRTSGEHVIRVFDSFIKTWPDAQSLANATEQELGAIVAPLGLVGRSRQILKAARSLVEQHDGEFPRDVVEAEALPQVGPYTARAVQVFARGERYPLVDWVIARVFRRFFGLDGTRRPNADRALWDLASSFSDLDSPRVFWFGVLDLGAQVCSRSPRCGECPLASGCAQVPAGSK